MNDKEALMTGMEEIWGKTVKDRGNNAMEK